MQERGFARASLIAAGIYFESGELRPEYGGPPPIRQTDAKV